MKITLNWLKQYVDYNKSPEDLKEDLTMLGMEVERMEQISSGFDKIVVAQIEESKPHPNADKLSVNRVNDGQGIRTIVCGAKNFKVGDKVPADCRVLQLKTTTVRVEESTLTGESKTIAKVVPRFHF